MQKLSLTALAREQLVVAGRSTSSRSASTVFGGHERTMRQTVIALLQDARLDEHENPGEATVLVLSGRVELSADGVWQARTGDLLVVPPVRHSLRGLEDSTVLLTAVPRGHGN